ncbi:carboxymuconolactone decarboxylase family protein [candidate division KSB1 bacterium]|nr:carboxymuconolactone decarboxylase family protein [candidate division KSB1 bacterium]
MLTKKDIEKIDGLYQDLLYSHNAFASRDSKAYESYQILFKESMKDGNLERMYKELIAVGIAVVTNCEGCQAYHINEALRNGATEEQVVEAIEVAVEMGGGPVVVGSSLAFKILEYLKDKKPLGMGNMLSYHVRAQLDKFKSKKTSQN